MPLALKPIEKPYLKEEILIAVLKSQFSMRILPYPDVSSEQSTHSLSMDKVQTENPPTPFSGWVDRFLMLAIRAALEKAKNGNLSKVFEFTILTRNHRNN